MKRWNYMIKHALRMFMEKEKFAYLYGANGEVGNDALVDAMWDAYPYHFQEFVADKGYTKEQLKDHVRGKICLDCSSFICYISQNENYEELRVVRDYNSAMLKDAFAVTRSPAAGTAGSVLYKPGHVALDIGYGVLVEFAAEFVDMRMRELEGAGFQVSGELPFVDYTGTSAR